MSHFDGWTIESWVLIFILDGQPAGAVVEGTRRGLPEVESRLIRIKARRCEYPQGCPATIESK